MRFNDQMAHSERHNMNVAVKIVSKFSAPADYLKKFLPREIEVVKGLKHPNLIRFLQAIETTHRLEIVKLSAAKMTYNFSLKGLHHYGIRREW